MPTHKPTNHEAIYMKIRKHCRNKLWTSYEFAKKFGTIKFTNRCREMQDAGERFKTATVVRNGIKYKGYQYLGKEAA